MSRDADFDVVTEASRSAPATLAVRAAPRLAWRAEGGEQERVVEAATVIGSAAQADLVLADPTVSRVHASVTPQAGGLWVRDLGSRNGTFVNGVQVREALVPEGGVILVGQTTLRLQPTPARTAVDLWPAPRYHGLVGGSAPMRELYARLDRVARSQATVLLQGETGSGKELAAQAIHAASARAAGPYVIVDCGALPDTLLEAELFGHAKGAFTGATSARAGAFEAADGGTVFLDEVGELPLSLQPKLLRVLESHTVRRLGETQHRKIDVRIVSATNRDLLTMVNEGAFREDLYFRLSVVPLVLPPLRSRREDLPLLVEHFCGPRATEAQRAEILALANQGAWLGNVRELRNFVERALVMGTGDVIAPATARRFALPAVPTDVPFHELREQLLSQLEREYVAALLAQTNGDTAEAARRAGLDRSYIYRLIRKHDL